MTNKLTWGTAVDVPRLELGNEDLRELLTMIYRLLMAYKEDHVDSLFLSGVPGLQDALRQLDSGETTPESPPALLATVEGLLVAKEEAAMEALQLGYLVGQISRSLRVPPLEAGEPRSSWAYQEAQRVIQVLGLTRFSKENLAFAIRLTAPAREYLTQASSGNGGQARTTPDIKEATATVGAAVAGS